MCFIFSKWLLNAVKCWSFYVIFTSYIEYYKNCLGFPSSLRLKRKGPLAQGAFGGQRTYRWRTDNSLKRIRYFCSFWQYLLLCSTYCILWYFMVLYGMYWLVVGLGGLGLLEWVFKFCGGIWGYFGICVLASFYCCLICYLFKHPWDLWPVDHNFFFTESW